MRWPIQIQLLLPMLLVVVLAIVLSSGAGAYLGGVRARHQQEEELARLVGTLTDASFPLSRRVLRQMTGLSGAEFVLLDNRGRPRDTTLALAEGELPPLGRIPAEPKPGGLAAGPRVSIGGRTYLSDRVPLARSRATAQADSLLVLYPEERWSAMTQRAAFPALAAGAVAIVVAVVITTLLAQRFVRPIKQLGARAAAVAGGDFQLVEVSRRNDEIRDLAVSINRMCERLGQYEEEVRRNERLRTLGQLGAGMAHQLRNAATGARMAIELHQRQCGGGSDRESLEVALRQLELMETHLQRFLALGRPGPAVREEVALGKLTEEVLALVGPTCRHARIDLRFAAPPEPICVRGDPESLRQLLVNLVLNAVEAAGQRTGAEPRVAVELEHRAGRALLRVKDSGPGPDAALAERIFEPFVTGKPDGTGLGLSVAHQVAEAHHGTVAWRREGEMTCFEVELPMVSGD